jgi:lipoprotein-anchoring transpeptidase ErfK/SrfK
MDGGTGVIRRGLGAAVGILGIVAALASPAAAAPDAVTLAASRTNLTFGQSTTLSGSIEPAAGGQTVEIVDAAGGAVLATTSTNGAGQYSVDVAPQANVDVVARWGVATSSPVGLRVTPALTVHLEGVRLFGTALVSGRLEPAHPGGSVEVRLLRGDHVAGRADAPVDGTAYEAEFEVLKPGNYRARVSFDDADHEPAEAQTDARRVKTPPSLHAGSNGPWVEILEQRLRDLDYHVPKPNRGFDVRTGDAVLAFHKVQGMRRVKSVSAATWKRLSDPRTPQPRASKPDVHVEIDQSRQVLYVVRDGEIDEIVHTSTGAGGATRDGVFHVHSKIAGFSPHHLYYPSYFDGARAVHGWPEVPAYPASHGCSRVPYWTAKFLFGIMGYGMEVRVYH